MSKSISCSVLLAGVMLLAILLAGCSSEPTPTSVATPIDTPAPTSTATLIPTATPTPPPTSTPTPRPTATPTPAQSGSDRNVLVALYHSTGGANWDANTNWLSDRPIGEWHGVTTNGNGRVIELNLPENQLTGEIPPELGGLSDLTGLWLLRNQLTGEIPPELGGLSNLTKLYLFSNQLTGEIPPELGGLSNLTELFLDDNQLTGEIPPELSSLLNLSVGLGLSENQLTGGIPPELGRLSNLTGLWLSRNQLTGEIPPELGGLSNLTWLSLANNQLTGCIPEGLRDIAENDLGQLNLPDCGAVTPEPTATPTPVPTATPTPVPTPWFDNPPDATHSEALDLINEMADQEPSYGTNVAGLSWVIDGVDWEEVRVLEILADALNEDQELARHIVSPDFRPYLSNPGLESISRVAEYEWLSDGLNANEMRALISIVGIAKHDHELAGSLLDFPWTSDGITDEESILIYSLSSLIPHRSGILERFLEYQWLADGVIRSERVALHALTHLSVRDPELARQALNYDWVVDGVTWDEHLVLFELHSTSERTRSHIRDADSRPPELAADFAWLANDLDANEIRAFIGIAMTRQLAPLIYDRLQEYSWVADGITRRESEILIDLYYTASNNVEFARQIVGMGLLEDPIRDSDAYALKFLQRLAGIPDGPTLLTNQPWFADGLDEEETAFVAALDAANRYSDAWYRSLLQTRYAQSTTITLPLAGEVRVWVFWHVPFSSSDDTLDLIEDVLIASERIMRVPFPTTDVILLFVDEASWGRGGGINTDEYMVVARSEGSPNPRHVIYHETAHYYDLGLSFWFNEGGAEFITAYTMDQVGFRSLETYREYLQGLTYCAEEGFENLQKLLDYEESHGCNYSLGNLFLLSLLKLLGNDVMSAALRELYLQPDLKGRDLSEEDFYRTFLKHTPSELRDEFRDLYKRLHGGPYPDMQE